MTPVEWSIIASISYMITEYWLGRTDKVKAGSVLEVGLNGLKAVAGAFKKKDV
jgi:hypothetical protein